MFSNLSSLQRYIKAQCCCSSFFLAPSSTRPVRFGPSLNLVKHLAFCLKLNGSPERIGQVCSGCFLCLSFRICIPNIGYFLQLSVLVVVCLSLCFCLALQPEERRFLETHTSMPPQLFKDRVESVDTDITVSG